MRIKKIKLTNYRQFHSAEFSLEKTKDCDLHVLIGTNGTGKTNILNAINWCLYGDEPHLSKDSELLPRLNIKTIEDSKPGADHTITVEVCTETNKSRQMIFRRTEPFRVHNQENVASLGSELEVLTTDAEGNTKIVQEDDACSLVERFVPNNIREFFFFDGERLDKYFRETTGPKIRNAIFQISQIDLLESRVKRKLGDIQGDISREAGKLNPKIEETRAELENAEKQEAQLEARVSKHENQIAEASARIAEYEDELSGLPDVDDLEEKRKRNEEELETLKKTRKEREKERNDLILELGRLLYLWPAMKRTSELIAEKKKKREIPPTFDRVLIEEILQTEICKVCGQALDEGGHKHVSDLLEQVTLHSEVVEQLFQMDAMVQQFTMRLDTNSARIKKIRTNLDNDQKRLSSIEADQVSINSRLAGYDTEEVAEWHRQRTRFEEVRDSNRENLGRFKAEFSKATVHVLDLRKKLNEQLSHEKKAHDLNTKMAFCTKALDIVEKTSSAIMNETRTKIEGTTKKNFFDLAWKKETFGDIEIREDYSVNLTHAMGYPFLGSLSAGERELLALSFTLALHETSGFDSPILIDTPVARISDLHRTNFAKVLTVVGENKQTILLFTPAEYSKEVSSELDSASATRHRIKLSSDEKLARIEVI